VVDPEIVDRLLHFSAEDAPVGHVEHVYVDTPLSQPVVAAFLRFPVPKPTGT
jgi:hypothetical protein